MSVVQFRIDKVHNVLYLSIMSQIGTRVRELRAAAELSQAELADRAGVHINTIKMLESGRGNATTDTIESLARALKCGPADLWTKPRRKSA